MLEITADKFHHLKGCCPPAGAFLLFVTEDDPAVFNLDDSTVSDGHLEDIGCQIFQATFTAADGLAVDIPVKFPDDRIYLPEQSGLYHCIPEFGPKDF